MNRGTKHGYWRTDAGVEIGLLARLTKGFESVCLEKKNRQFYKKCNLVINRHLLRRINSSLPQ